MLTSRLYELQRIDIALGNALARRHSLNDGAPQRAALALAVEREQMVRHMAATVQGRLRALELEIQSLVAKRARLEADMYSGRIGNPKELSAMHEDAASLGRHKARLEDEVLGLLEQAEGLDREQRDAQVALATAESDLARTLDAYRRQVEATDQEVADLTARRHGLAAELDEELLRRYERLREQKGGVAVVAVRGGVCDGCHVVIPHRLVTRLQRDPDMIAACDGCGRILAVLPASGDEAPSVR